jgi:phosphoribosyl-dephospho-CoA transferase
VTEPRPHDLLHLARPGELVPAAAPAWVAPALRVAPWVVVRRASAPPGHLPVGVRGRHRDERFALQIPMDHVAKVLPPDALTARAGALPDLPAARALHVVRPLLATTGLCWGPGGSVGFELATGLPTITADSDLDLVIRVERLLPRSELAALHAALRRLPARADCQLDTPTGALALAELVSGAGQVLLRTATGPRLVPVPGAEAGA